MTWHDADGDFHKRTVDTEDEAGRLLQSECRCV